MSKHDKTEPGSWEPSHGTQGTTWVDVKLKLLALAGGDDVPFASSEAAAVLATTSDLSREVGRWRKIASSQKELLDTHETTVKVLRARVNELFEEKHRREIEATREGLRRVGEALVNERLVSDE